VEEHQPFGQNTPPPKGEGLLLASHALIFRDELEQIALLYPGFPLEIVRDRFSRRHDVSPADSPGDDPSRASGDPSGPNEFRRARTLDKPTVAEVAG
jgi:hypothetical protein